MQIPKEKAGPANMLNDWQLNGAICPTNGSDIFHRAMGILLYCNGGSIYLVYSRPNNVQGINSEVRNKTRADGSMLDPNGPWQSVASAAEHNAATVCNNSNRLAVDLFLPSVLPPSAVPRQPGAATSLFTFGRRLDGSLPRVE